MYRSPGLVKRILKLGCSRPFSQTMRPFLLTYETFLAVETTDEKVSVAAESVVAGPGAAMSYSPNLS